MVPSQWRDDNVGSRPSHHRNTRAWSGSTGMRSPGGGGERPTRRRHRRMYVWLRARKCNKQRGRRCWGRGESCLGRLKNRVLNQIRQGITGAFKTDTFRCLECCWINDTSPPTHQQKKGNKINKNHIQSPHFAFSPAASAPQPPSRSRYTATSAFLLLRPRSLLACFAALWV